MKTAQVFLLVPFICAAFVFSAAPQQPSSAQGWRQTQQTDAVRGEYTRYSLSGKFLKTPPGDASNRPSLVVD